MFWLCMTMYKIQDTQIILPPKTSTNVSLNHESYMYIVVITVIISAYVLLVYDRKFK